MGGRAVGRGVETVSMAPGSRCISSLWCTSGYQSRFRSRCGWYILWILTAHISLSRTGGLLQHRVYNPLRVLCSKSSSRINESFSICDDEAVEALIEGDTVKTLVGVRGASGEGGRSLEGQARYREDKEDGGCHGDWR